MIENFQIFIDDKKLKKLFQKKDYNKVKKLLQKNSGKKKNSSEYYLLNSFLAFESKDLKLATQFIDSAKEISANELELKEYETIKLKSDYCFLLLDIAKYCVSIGDYEQALNKCKEILSKNDQFYESVLLMAKIYAENGDYENAKTLLEDNLEKFNEIEEFKIRLLQIYFELGEFEECHKILKSLSAEAKKDIRVECINLKLLMNQGKSKEIEFRYKELSIENFLLYDFFTKYFELIQNNNELEILNTKFRKFVSEQLKDLDKKDVELNFFEKQILKATLHFYDKEPEEAIEILTELLEKNEKINFVYFIKAKIFFEYENYNDCIKNLGLFHKNTKGTIESKFLLASALFYLKKTDEAEAIFNDILSINKNHFETLFKLGQICEERGEINKAIEYYQKVYDICQMYLPVIKKLATIYISVKNYDKANAFINNYLKYNNKDDLIYWYSGFTLNKLNFKYEAIHSYEKAIELNKNRGEYYFNLANIQIEVGKTEDAISNLNKAKNLLKEKSNEIDFLLATAYYKANKFLETIDLLNSLIKKNFKVFEASFFIAKCHYEMQNYEEAINLLEKLNEENENNISVILLLAKTYIKLEQYENALNLYKKLMSIYPDDDEILLNVADFHYKLKEYSEAESYYLKILSRDPDNLVALENLSLIYEINNNLNNAISYLLKLVNRYQEKSEYKLRLANLYIKIEDYDNALKIYDDLDEDQKEKYEVKFNSGKIFFSLGKIDQALEKFESLYEEDKNNLDVLYYLGLIEKSKNNFIKAIEYFEKALILDQNNSGVISNLAELHYEIDNLDRALTLSERGLTLNFSDQKMILLRALIFKKMGKINDAINSLKFLVEFNPENYSALKELGNLYYLSEEYQEALDYYERALTYDEDIEIIEKVATIFHNFSEYKKALEFFLRLKEKNKNIKRINYKIACIYYDLGELNKALEYLDEEYKINPDDNEIIIKRGDVYYLSEDYDKAIEYYNDALMNERENEDIYFKLGETYAKKSDNLKAIECFSKAIELNPDNFYYHLSLARFYKKIDDKINALNEYRIANDLTDDKTIFFNELINFLIETQNYNESISLLQKQIINDSLNPELYFLLGLSYFKNGDYDNSIKNLEYCIGLDESNSSAHFVLSKVYNLKGNFDKALQHSVKAMSLNPNINKELIL